MSDSLVVSNLIELLGGGVQSPLAQCLGAYFRLGTSYDLGTPDPTTDYVASLILDGERPYGRRSSNRVITLPVVIVAGDRLTLAAARETLMRAVDADQWQLTWTRDDGGLPMILDCFRAMPAVVTYSLYQEQNYISQVTLQFQALPYGRSDAVTEVAFASPVAGQSAPASPVVLDNYSAVSGTGWAQSTQSVVGPHSAYWAATGTGYPVYHATFAGKNLTGLTALTCWMGLGSGSNDSWYNWHKGPVQVSFTLTDNAARTVTFGATRTLTASNTNAIPAFARVSVPIPAALGSFNIASVTGYSVKVTNYTAGREIQTTAVYLDALTAVPQTVSVPATQRGAAYAMLGVLGSARAPLNLNVQQPAAAQQVTQVLTGSGVWYPPPGVTSVKAECWGGGGAGGSRTTSGFGAGGGGGEYAAEPSLALSGSSPVPFACGAGGTAAGASSTPHTQSFSKGGSASWTCPATVTSVTVQAWGAGGGGGATDSFTGHAGGGGGGEFAQDTVAVTPGHVYTVLVGGGGKGGGVGGGAPSSEAGGDSTFHGDSLTVTANGGSRGAYASIGKGGTGSANATHHNGGNGGNTAAANHAGGGGSSAGTAAAGGTGGNGSSGSGGAGGTPPSGAGGGGTGGGSAGGGGASPGGGGGGASNFTGNSRAGAGADGKVVLAWAVSAAGAPATAGGSTTFATVTAHGAASVAVNTTTASAAGTGSANTTHHAGGAGHAASGASGGGGAGADSTGTGVASGGTAGGIAALDGGNGGDAATSANTAGNDGASPGGGGGGADSTGTAVPGGDGGDGQIQVTYTQTLTPFSTLIAHRPGPSAPPTLAPWVSFGGSDAPDGREYAVPSLIAGVNARFGGTYTAWLVAYQFDTPSAERTVAVTVNQYEYAGGPVVSATVDRTFIPDADSPEGMIALGEITLPVAAIAADNTTAAYFTVSCTSSNASDLFLDVLFLDTQGQTVILSGGNSYVNYWIDEPGTSADIGLVLGSSFDRSQAVSVLSETLLSGGPITVEPGDNLLFLYSIAGAPAVYANYYARWLIDRIA